MRWKTNHEERGDRASPVRAPAPGTRAAMTEHIQFSFDPRCPWCFQTSRWARALEEQGAVRLTWSVFCLELNNFEGERKDFDPSTCKSGPALRTSVVVREQEGQAACGRFYGAIGQRYFYGLEDLTHADTVRAALVDAGLGPEHFDEAMTDMSSWDIVVREHDLLDQEAGGFGVPSLRLDAGTGPCMFGPVIRDVPSDEEAVALLDHVVWLMRNENFYELKSGRTDYPDLPHIRRALAERRSG